MPSTAPAKAAATPVWPLQSNLAGMRATFGNPDANGDGAPDPAWVTKHLTTITPPYGLFYGDKRVKAITVNRACSEQLLGALTDILGHYKTEEAIRDVGLHNYGGCYAFRVKRGNANSLSMHAYACAIDMDPVHNPFRGRKHTMPAEAVAIFKAHGAVWGGDWSAGSYDPMHFQWARVK